MLTHVRRKFDFDKPRSETRPTITRAYPRKLTDLFAGEQLVWVGRYREPGPVKLTLSGDLSGKRQTYTVTANLAAHSVPDANAFVEKVWATRRIGELIDEIDLNGKNRELTDELVHLSLKYGIMTPYTSFLADERVDLANRSNLNRRAGESLNQLQAADGASGFEQRKFKQRAKSADLLPPPANFGGGFGGMGGGGMGGGGAGMGGGFGGGMGGAAVPSPAPVSPMSMSGKSVRSTRKRQTAPQPSEHSEVSSRPVMQTVGDKTFYWKNNRWRDADLTEETEKNPIRVAQFSDGYFALAAHDNGRFAKYFALDGPILVRLDDKTYLIEPVEAN